MKYFSNLPLIVKTDTNNNSLVVTNLLSRSYILPSLLKNVVLFYDYDVNDDRAFSLEDENEFFLDLFYIYFVC